MTKTAELQKPIYSNEEAARAHYEAIRWPQGPVCFHCGSDNVARLGGEAHRKGLFQCREKECRGQFTAVMGTVFEKSHIPLHKWLLAMHLMCSSKKGISASQLHRELGFGSYRTAWFMAHRIREAMALPAPTRGRPPMGGEGGIVEVDETYFGKVAKEDRRTTTTQGKPFTKGGKSGPSNKRAVVSLVERGGSVRSFHVAMADKFTVTAIIKANVSDKARLMTDESKLYFDAHTLVSSHETVKHAAGEYARGDVNTNSVEGYFSVFKRGMRGVYQHCKEKHLHRYLAEFDFRHNRRTALGIDDATRTDMGLSWTVGKRLTYRRTHAA
jgi:transposase-like protein